MLAGAHWGLLLVGDFGERSPRHALPASDEQKAYERAAWWRAWRSDVEVAVIVREGPGGAWKYAEEGVWV